MARIIGIRHRRKKTVNEEARPTEVAIQTEGDPVIHQLEDEDAEMDFLLGRFPVAHEAVGDQDIEWFNKDTAPGGVKQHHCKWKKIKDKEVITCQQNHIRSVEDDDGNTFQERVTKIPSVFDGLRQGDRVAMCWGGSGSYFAAALSRRGETIGAEVFCIPPYALDEQRGSKSKDDDHILLMELLSTRPDLFAKLMPKDRQTMRVAQKLRLRMDAMKARVGCGNRLKQRLVGNIFFSEEGCYPEGLIKDEYDVLKASDPIFQGLQKEEKLCDKELEQVVKGMQIWKKLFESIPGLGCRMASDLIAGIGDIQRFAVTEGKNRTWKTICKVKAFCGAHVLCGGKHQDVPKEHQFPKRRAGYVANWHPGCRQALYLFMDQLNRQTKKFTQAKAEEDTAMMQKYYWAGILLESKEYYRQKYPEPVEVQVGSNGKTYTVTRYSKMHIHKMAQKRTTTLFVEWMAKKWLEIEGVLQGN